MMTNAGAHSELPPLPYPDWEPTKTTLHLWTQIVGKIRLAATPHRNQWWNVTLYFTPRGLEARGMRRNGIDFTIEFDFIAHRLEVRTCIGGSDSFALHDGLSVAQFYANIMTVLEKLGVDTAIRARPYGIPITTPFAQDAEHAQYDRAAVERWWFISRWTTQVMDRFAAGFTGKQSLPHLFWHSFDLAMSRYNGRRAPVRDGAGTVEREAYAFEVIAFGFWPGDANVKEPTYYTYTAPEPTTLTTFALRPQQARWSASGASHLGALAYDAVRSAADPQAALLDFFHSGYDAGAAAAGWDLDPLTARR
jgi:hypothetical protein